MSQQQDAVTINMGDLNIGSPGESNGATKKKQDTLFGPNIGIVAKGPEWAEAREKTIDELTPEIVRGWIAKSKEVSRCRLCHPHRTSFPVAVSVSSSVLRPARGRLLRPG